MERSSSPDPPIITTKALPIPTLPLADKATYPALFEAQQCVMNPQPSPAPTKGNTEPASTNPSPTNPNITQPSSPSHPLFNLDVKFFTFTELLNKAKEYAQSAGF